MPAPLPLPAFPVPLAKMLATRGIETEQQLRLFLNPPHRLSYSPMRLAGMEAALYRLRSITSAASPSSPAPRVGIVGDFDVDGITGTAILVEGLADLGIEAIPYLPHRVSEGHGLSEEAVNVTLRTAGRSSLSPWTAASLP